jgi:crossover junction endodeoxyribonuclease RusA
MVQPMSELKNKAKQGIYQLTLPLPPSVNTMYATNFRTGRRFKGKKYAEWLLKVEAYLLENNIKLPEITGKIAVDYKLGKFPDKRRRDAANYEKALSDFLTANNVIEDDCFIQDNRQRWTKEIQHGFVQINITTWSDENDI